MSQVQITLPNEPKETLNSVVFMLKEELDVKNMILLSGDNNSLIIFRRLKTEVSEVMSRLSKIGVGVDYGIIDILPLNASIPAMASTSENKKVKSEDKLKSRVSLEEIRTNISEVSSIDLNFLVFIILASLVAGAGLLSSAPTVLIASMILSPLMGPILAVSYGVVIKDNNIVKQGLKGQLLGICIGLSIGILMGIFTLIFTPDFVLTDEMSARSYPGFLDVIIAICGGIAVGFCITGSVRSALVGVAIAVALLPPAVNSGIVLLLGEFNLAFGSFTLMLMNIVVINLCAFLVFRLKDIESIPETPSDWIGPEEDIKPDIPEVIIIETKKTRWQKLKDKISSNK